MSAYIDLSQNYSFYALPLAWFLTFVPGAYAKSSGGGKNYDLANPRQYIESVQKDERLTKAAKNKILRCEAAAANGRETLGVFIGAVLAANYASVPVETINTLAGSYLASRAAYNFIYIVLQENRKFAPLRSLVWIYGIGVCMTLFVKAGNRL
ncbi:hypothetical protein F4861DRAFT_351370 [Xylaria intraflava]|nr:hypothetical protein F4861DRAFT_351370 [Xylaria intraflava]